VTARLLQRRVLVQLGTAGSTGKEYDGLRVRFAVTMTDSSTPNEAKVEIYNVAASTVSAMQSDDAVIRLLVGYASEGAPRLLFQGNPISNGVQLERKGVDTVLTVEAQDGGREYTSSHLAESYGTGTTSAQVFAALADSLGVPLGNVDAVVGTIDFPSGIVLQGRASDQLDRVAAMSGARWQIRDGALQVWSVGGSTGEQAVVFSASTGNLIGSPAVTDDGVEITGLLAPTLRPGKPFRVDSRDVQGDYVCTSCEFKGDSGWGSEFYVVAKGTPLAA
jgi:hypothetical protein